MVGEARFFFLTEAPFFAKSFAWKIVGAIIDWSFRINFLLLELQYLESRTSEGWADLDSFMMCKYTPSKKNKGKYYRSYFTFQLKILSLMLGNIYSFLDYIFDSKWTELVSLIFGFLCSNSLTINK